MFSLNNNIINFFPKAVSYAEKCVKNLLKGNSDNKSRENYSSVKDSSDNFTAVKQDVSLRRELRYQLLSYNFSIDKYYEINCLNAAINHLGEIDGYINSFVSDKLGEIGRVYSEGFSLILNSSQQGLISKSASLSMISVMNTWYSEITSKLDDFNIQARNLLAQKIEKVMQLKNRLTHDPFDRASADSLMQELEDVKQDPSLNECIKKWDEEYLIALRILDKHQSALHYASVNRTQRRLSKLIFA